MTLKRKAIAIISSPRKNGNMAILTNKLLDSSKDKLGIEKIHLKDYDINPYKECYHCIENKECSIKDEMQDLYSKLKESQVIVLSSPIFMGGVNSYLKTFMERR